MPMYLFLQENIQIPSTPVFIYVCCSSCLYLWLLGALVYSMSCIKTKVNSNSNNNANSKK
eukprot:m.280403 g.280403  ORF g.280403 m.280403 type:complete len:60 (+) comp107764_c0_seq1:59-238(+)